jgi:hypothetical protein
MISRRPTSPRIWVIFIVEACSNTVSKYGQKVLRVLEAFPTARRFASKPRELSWHQGDVSSAYRSGARLSNGATDCNSYSPADLMYSRKPTRTKLSRWLMPSNPSMRHNLHHITITVITKKIKKLNKYIIITIITCSSSSFTSAKTVCLTYRSNIY